MARRVVLCWDCDTDLGLGGAKRRLGRTLGVQGRGFESGRWAEPSITRTGRMRGLVRGVAPDSGVSTLVQAEFLVSVAE